MRSFLLSAVFTVMVSFVALAVPPGVVLVQYHWSSRLITVTRGPGKTENIPTSPINEKNYAVNAERLQELFAKLYEEGYSLQNSSTIAAGFPSIETVTYVFVKP